MSDRRVVVTGLGIVSPLGIGKNKNWNDTLAGISGIGQITLFDTSTSAVTIAGEVRSFKPTDYLSVKDVRRMDRFIQFGMVAADEAVDDAGIESTDENQHRIGVVIGAGMGGITTIENTSINSSTRGLRRISPFYVPKSIINLAAGNVSMKFGFKGPNLAISTACTTGTHCIGEALRMIQLNDADVMVAGGVEAAITPTSVAGFANARALSRRNSDPEGASRPWDLGRDGFVISEGAGIVVLEELEFAKKRGAHIYAEMTGFGMSSDAYHLTSPSPGGEGAYMCMYNTLQNGGINSEEVDYINAHGTSTPQGDIAETYAIKRLFESHANDLAVSSSKSMVGHLLGAAGGVEAIYTILAIYHQTAPPTINLEDPDPECDLDYVADGSRPMQIRNAISNSFGFGGTNGCISFQQFN